MRERDMYTLAVGAKGRLILPVALQRRAQLEEGDQLVVTVKEDGSLHIVRLRDQAKQCEGLFRHLAPNRSLVDELIAERRQEAENDELCP